MRLDGNANVYVMGSTNSTSNFPSQVAGSLQATGLNTNNTASAVTDAFIAKIAAAGTSFSYSSYLGGTGDEVGTAIAVNPTCTGSCEAFFAGSTTSGSGFFNTNALQ